MIIAPPSNLKRYLTARIEQLTRLQDRANNLAPRIMEAGKVDDGRMLDSWLRYTGCDPEISYFATRYDSFSTYYIKKLNLPDIIDACQNALRYGSSFVRYVVSMAEPTYSPSVEEKAFFKALERAEDGAEIYGFMPEDPKNLEYPEYVTSLTLAEGLKELGSILVEASEIKSDMHRRTKAWVDLSNSLSPHKWRPEHDVVETVYHASLYAGVIAMTGFSQTKPPTRKGLGNFGTQATISMTAEREIAEDAVNCFLDVWDIAHGHISPNDILTLIKDENLDIDFRPHFGHAEVTQLTAPTDAMKLYRLYLAHTQTRFNPLFVNPEELLDAACLVERKDIGILECEVRIDETTEFLVGECEFRVHPDDVRYVTLLPFAANTIKSEPEAVGLEFCRL